MKKNLPAKRYDPFITFFEKIVTEKQKEIEAARRLEAIYVVAKDILEKYDFKNDVKIEKDNDFVLGVYIVAQENDHWEDFIPFLEDIAKELKRKNLRESGEIPIMSTPYLRGTLNYWRFSASKDDKLFLDINLSLVPNMKYYKMEIKQIDVAHNYWEGEWLEKQNVTQ